jgi:O-antigen/teichoic acid export membrane protein
VRLQPEVQVTARNAGLLLLQRSSHIIYAVLFAALVPRAMGPVTYGQFNLLTALTVWLVFSASLGITQISGRYVPEFLHREDNKACSNLSARWRLPGWRWAWSGA